MLLCFFTFANSLKIWNIFFLENQFYEKIIVCKVSTVLSNVGMLKQKVFTILVFFVLVFGQENVKEEALKVNHHH